MTTSFKYEKCWHRKKEKKETTTKKTRRKRKNRKRKRKYLEKDKVNVTDMSNSNIERKEYKRRKRDLRNLIKKKQQQR